MPNPSGVDLGNYDRIPNLTAGSLNADLVPSTDVSHYAWISLYIDATTYSGTLSFQGSFDNSTWVNVMMYVLTSLDAHDAISTTSSTSQMIGGPVRFPFFRVRMTSYTSGNATGTMQLLRDGLPGFQLLTTSATISDTGVTANRIGLTGNDGLSNVAIAASVATDTVVLANTGFLSHVLVTATGTHEMDIYDNASAGSGVIVGLVPANPTVNGIPIACKAPTLNGITVKGNSNNPGVTIFYTNV